MRLSTNRDFLVATMAVVLIFSNLKLSALLMLSIVTSYKFISSQTYEASSTGTGTLIAPKKLLNQTLASEEAQRLRISFPAAQTELITHQKTAIESPVMYLLSNIWFFTSLYLHQSFKNSTSEKLVNIPKTAKESINARQHDFPKLALRTL